MESFYGLDQKLAFERRQSIVQHKKWPYPKYRCGFPTPEVIQSLKKYYPAYWDSVSPRMKPVYIDIGNPNELSTTLCSQDWYMHGGNPPWNFSQIRSNPKVSHPWKIQCCTSWNLSNHFKTNAKRS